MARRTKVNCEICKSFLHSTGEHGVVNESRRQKRIANGKGRLIENEDNNN